MAKIDTRSRYIDRIQHDVTNNQIIFVISDGSRVAVDCKTLVDVTRDEQQEDKKIIAEKCEMFCE